MENLLAHGYKGKLYPVNPKYNKVLGLKAFPSLEWIKGDIDLAILILRAELIPQLLRQCEQKKVGSVLIISAGFREEGSEKGIEREEWVKEWSERTGIPVCGPNCLGLQSQAVDLCASAASSIGHEPFPAGSVGLISHSGATAFGPLLNRGKDTGVYFRYILSTGNEAGCSMTEYADAMLEDTEITAVALFIEGIKDGTAFVRLAEKALSLGKPLVVMKIGESEVGQRAAASHTASMTGDQDVFQALCRQKGIAHVKDYDQLLYTLLSFNQKKSLDGKRLVVISHSGGIGGFVSDRLGANGFEVPAFREETVRKTAAENPGFGSSQNPLDLSGTMQTERMPKIFAVLEL
ncbi:MAG TPA: CoA-binding protein, partial [Bacillales bacterium]|nr:CoA-binding protein [Bacillales bacterium]